MTEQEFIFIQALVKIIIMDGVLIPLAFLVCLEVGVTGKSAALLKSTGIILLEALESLEDFMVTCPSDFNISCVKVEILVP